MSTLVEISVVVVAAFIVIFILVLIPVLIKVGRAVNELAKLTDMVRVHIPPVAHDLAIIFSKAKDVSGSVTRQVHQIEGTVQKFKTYEAIFDEKVGKPIIDLVALISGLVKGISTFLYYMRK